MRSTEIIFNRIADEILQHLHQQVAIALHPQARSNCWLNLQMGTL
ncbi:MAG TPA: hypothetical protein V6D16_07855 [Candidatus Obscuribacterales bacterium]